MAYSFIILPVSVVRWSSFSGRHIPDWATFFSVFMHDMFGATNVALLVLTKPNLLLFDRPEDAEKRGRTIVKRQRGQALGKEEEGSDDGPFSFDEGVGGRSFEMHPSTKPQDQPGSLSRSRQSSESSASSRLGGGGPR